MTVSSQLVEFIASSLAEADKSFVDDFIQNGPIPGGPDGACRYLLAVALRKVSASDFATLTGVSEAVSVRLLAWLENGTKG